MITWNENDLSMGAPKPSLKGRTSDMTSASYQQIKPFKIHSHHQTSPSQPHPIPISVLHPIGIFRWKPPVWEPSLDGRRTRRRRTRRRLHQAAVGPPRGVALQDLHQVVLAGQELAWNPWPHGPMASRITGENWWRSFLLVFFEESFDWWPLVARKKITEKKRAKFGKWK